MDMDNLVNRRSVLVAGGLAGAGVAASGLVTPAQAVSTGLASGASLTAGNYLRSNNNRYKFVMQSDGNLVLYTSSGRVLWASNTDRKGGRRVVMQTDGNLVIRTPQNKAVWASNTAGKRGARLSVQGDGNVVLYVGSRPVWATNTVQRAGSSGLGGKVDAFKARFDRRYVDYDGAYGAQCVDLFNYYNRDVVGAPFVPASYAYQLYDNAPSSRYAKIGATSSVRKGDVAVWSSSFGGYGHVAVVLGASGSGLTVFGQNWPLGAPCQVVTTSRSKIRGFLRPRV